MKALLFSLLFFVGCAEWSYQEPDNTTSTSEGDDMSQARRRPPIAVHLDLDHEGHEYDKLIGVVEPREGAWTNSPQWGSGYSGPMPDSAGVVLPIFGIDRPYGSPAVHSLSLFATGIQGVNAALRARIQYGTGAVQNVFEADFLNGAQFSLVADHLRIMAVTFAPDSAVPYNPADGAIKVTACIAKGAIAKTQPLTYTEPLKTIFPATGFAYNVKPLARAFVLNIQGNSDPATPSSISIQMRSGAQIIASYDAQIMAGNMGGLSIPAGVDRINVYNGSGGNAVASLQWQLGI